MCQEGNPVAPIHFFNYPNSDLQLCREGRSTLMVPPVTTTLLARLHSGQC